MYVCLNEYMYIHKYGLNFAISCGAAWGLEKVLFILCSRIPRAYV